MSKYLPCLSSLVSSLLLTAACGDSSSPAQPDAAQPDAAQSDAAEPDARTCDTSNYPQAVQALSVDLQDPFALTLDGNGSRCDQIGRALTDPDPTKRPPELAELDPTGATWTCSHDDLLDREIVRMRVPQYAGLPLFAPTQEVLAHVSADPATVVFLHGDFLPANAASLPDACLDGDQIGASLPGHTLTYTRFALCLPQGEGTYDVASDDVIEPGEEGYLLDREGMLRRVREVDVYLHPDNVSDDTINSDMYCCSGRTLEHCVGQRLYIDAVTGEYVDATSRCHTC